MCVHVQCRTCVEMQLQACEAHNTGLKCSICRRPLERRDLVELRLTDPTASSASATVTAAEAGAAGSATQAPAPQIEVRALAAQLRQAQHAAVQAGMHMHLNIAENGRRMDSTHGGAAYRTLPAPAPRPAARWADIATSPAPVETGAQLAWLRLNQGRAPALGRTFLAHVHDALADHATGFKVRAGPPYVALTHDHDLSRAIDAGCGTDRGDPPRRPRPRPGPRRAPGTRPPLFP